MSVIEEAFYNLVSQGATGRAINEMIESQIPGRTNGPADAYRHILLALISLIMLSLLTTVG